MTIAIGDYPYQPRPRRLHSRIEALIAIHADRYRERLLSFLELQSELECIPIEPGPQPDDLPCWNNGWLPAMDTVSLYGFIAHRRPRTYVEIGSGHSTKFARLSIRNNRLATRVVSIDPAPRAEVDQLCDQVIRCPLENADLAIFDSLAAGDIVFMDSSHRAFQNSDVTVFFTEILPGLPRGVLYGIHDIFLPFDYGVPTLPKDWQDLPEPFKAAAAPFEAFVPRYYNEQYLLACYLLGGADRDKIVLPCAFASSRSELAGILAPLWSAIGPTSITPWGGTFWAERGTEAL